MRISVYNIVITVIIQGVTVLIHKNIFKKVFILKITLLETVFNQCNIHYIHKSMCIIIIIIIIKHFRSRVQKEEVCVCAATAGPWFSPAHRSCNKILLSHQKAHIL